MASVTTDLPSHRALPPFGWCQIVLLGDTWALTTCPELLPDGAPARSQTRDLSIMLTTTPPSHTRKHGLKANRIEKSGYNCKMAMKYYVCVWKQAKKPQ